MDAAISMTKNVSICIPVYNGERWLKECLESAIACTIACEIIICDDQSHDSSVTIAEEFAALDKRVHVYRNERNLGLVGNWNQCLKHAKGEWIKFLFQDDRLHAGSVEKMLEKSRADDMLIAGHRNYVFTENSSRESIEYYTKKVLTLDLIAPGITRFSAGQITSLACDYIARNFIGEPSTVMFRRSVLDAVGEFNPSLKQICDLEFWLRIAGKHGLLFVPEAAVDFTVHDESASATNYSANAAGFDSLRLVDEMLFGESFRDLRNHLSAGQERRLKLWLRVHAYEAKVTMNPVEVELLFAERPQIGNMAEKFGTGLLYQLLKLRRK